MTVLTETRERFLLAIAAQVPAERIAEMHFFQPIRQGGVESGVAVVAVWPAEADAPAAPAAPDGVDSTPSPGEGVTVEQHAENIEEPIEPTEEIEPIDEIEPVEEIELVDDADQLERGELRPTIYTARYRLTLKGPDRGKWEFHVVAEADAPLVTLGLVVRGVQRRAGDLDDATRMEGDDVRALLHAAMSLRAAR
jgi:hypothetical protein